MSCRFSLLTSPPSTLFFLAGNIDNNKSSITNGICCSTNSKNTKTGRKNSNFSQQDPEKKPLNNNNISSNASGNEPFDGIDQIISNVNTGTLKPKKISQCKNKDRKKLHGSLPNHLDTDVDCEGSDETNSSGESSSVFCCRCVFLSHTSHSQRSSLSYIRLSIKAEKRRRKSKRLHLLQQKSQSCGKLLNCLTKTRFFVYI